MIGHACRAIGAVLVIAGMVGTLFGGGISASAQTDKSADDHARGEAAFSIMAEVMQHPRCLNCHVQGDAPRRGMERELHRFGVQRGPDNQGVAAFRCMTCHREHNFDAVGIPGAHRWSLAPPTTGWVGLEPFAMCFALTDPDMNGGRTPAEVKRHLETDPLVHWAWSPGIDPEGVPRETPPVSYEEFMDAVVTWVQAGAPCP